VAADATPEEFAGAVIEVLSQRQEQERLIRQSRNWLLSRYDWERLGGELLGFYEQIMQV